MAPKCAYHPAWTALRSLVSMEIEDTYQPHIRRSEVELRKSSLHGVGVFATEDIREDVFIGEYAGVLEAFSYDHLDNDYLTRPGGVFSKYNFTINSKYKGSIWSRCNGARS